MRSALLALCELEVKDQHRTSNERAIQLFFSSPTFFDIDALSISMFGWPHTCIVVALGVSNTS